MTTSQRALARTTPKRAALPLAKAHVSQHLSRRLPYYITPDEAHQLVDVTETERNRLFLRLLWETGVRVSEAIRLRLEDVGRQGIRVLGKGSVERVVFVQDGLVSGILFYAQENGLDRDDFLFPSRKGGHITKQRADQVIKSGEAGRLVAGAGETTATVRRRIGAAAKAAGLKLTIRRTGDEVYFWVERRRAANGRRRRGRGDSS